MSDTKNVFGLGENRRDRKWKRKNKWNMYLVGGEKGEENVGAR